MTGYIVLLNGDTMPVVQESYERHTYLAELTTEPTARRRILEFLHQTGPSDYFRFVWVRKSLVKYVARTG
jgi:hypothetical protein